MHDYRLRCCDDGAPRAEESAIAFPDEDEAVYAALELACNYQKVELWRGEALTADLARTNEPAMAPSRVLH